MALDVSIAVQVGQFDLKVEFDVDLNSTTAILGPSGAGKTLTLRTIAGLLRPDHGHVSFGNRPLFNSLSKINVPARERKAGLVFQDYMLFPHLSVANNIAYALSGTSRDSARCRVSEIIEMLGLIGLESSFPSNLSGGQKQRVALGRALAPQPDFLLLDEPFSALDSPTRSALTERLLELESRLAAPTVLVTHDLAEAHALARNLVLLDHGTVLQSGPRDDVFNRPVSPHAGKLLGVQNVLPGRVLSINDGIASIDVAGAEWQFLAKGLSENQAITVGARAQDLIAFPDAHGASTLVREIDSGLHRTVVVSLPRGAEVYAELTAEMDRRVGRTLPPRWSLSVATGTGFVWNDAADDQCLLSSCS